MQLTVKDLREALKDVPDDAVVVFQTNEPGEEDEGDEATYTTGYGTVFAAFHRGAAFSVDHGFDEEFVIDGKITNME